MFVRTYTRSEPVPNILEGMFQEQTIGNCVRTYVWLPKLAYGGDARDMIARKLA